MIRIGQLQGGWILIPIVNLATLSKPPRFFFRAAAGSSGVPIDKSMTLN
jgi:hypothetical protein